MHPKLPEFIKYARDADVADIVEMFTNGSKLEPVLNQKIVDAGLQRMNISVEGLTETWTTIFKDYDSYIELAHGAMNQENIGTREKYCSDNNILFEDRSYED